MNISSLSAKFNPKWTSLTYNKELLYIDVILSLFLPRRQKSLCKKNSTILDEVSQLPKTLCNVAGSQISVKRDLLLTMSDGKVCNALTNTSSTQNCYICGATAMKNALHFLEIKRRQVREITTKLTEATLTRYTKSV